MKSIAYKKRRLHDDYEKNFKSENAGDSMDIEWVAVVIAANREGMLSLAKQLTALAEAAPGQHIHFDEFNSLEEGSAEMIIVREK